jgi:hypothetical protein
VFTLSFLEIAIATSEEKIRIKHRFDMNFYTKKIRLKWLNNMSHKAGKIN